MAQPVVLVKPSHRPMRVSIVASVLETRGKNSPEPSQPDMPRVSGVELRAQDVG